jgi:hypothetical protein
VTRDSEDVTMDNVDVKWGMRVIGPRKRKRPAAGDFFEFVLESSDRALVGRMVLDKVGQRFTLAGQPLYGGPGQEAGPSSLLVYIYRPEITAASVLSGDSPVPPVLLIPPQITNMTGWWDGVFKALASRPLLAGETLPRHVFEKGNGRLVDELDNPVVAPEEPGEYIGFMGLTPYGAIADDIRRALSR